MGTICKNKHNKDVRVCFLSINKFFTFVNVLTIDQPYKSLVFL